MKIQRVNITLDQYTLSVLDDFTHPRNISRSQVIRLAVAEYVRNHAVSDAPLTPVGEELLRKSAEKIEKLKQEPSLPKPKKKEKTSKSPIVKSFGLSRGELDVENYL